MEPFDANKKILITGAAGFIGYHLARRLLSLGARVAGMDNMNAYYDFSGQKFGHPLSLSINGFDRQVFSQQTSLELSYVLEGQYEVITEGFSRTLDRHQLALIAPGEIHMIRKAPDAENSAASVILTVHIDFERMPERWWARWTACSPPWCAPKRKTPPCWAAAPDAGPAAAAAHPAGAQPVSAERPDDGAGGLCASGARRPMESIPLQSPLHESSRRAIRFINGTSGRTSIWRTWPKSWPSACPIPPSCSPNTSACPL